MRDTGENAAVILANAINGYLENARYTQSELDNLTAKVGITSKEWGEITNGSIPFSRQLYDRITQELGIELRMIPGEPQQTARLHPVFQKIVTDVLGV